MTATDVRRRYGDLKATGLASWVRSASDERLAAVMRSPLRRLLLGAIVRTIAQRAQPGAGVTATVDFQIGGGRDGASDRYRVTLAGGRGRVSRRGAGPPALSLELEPVAFLRLAGGTAGIVRLWLTGRLRLRGDLALALTLPAALRLPAVQAPARRRRVGSRRP